MITLYHCPLTRSIRIYWLLEELGLPYKLERVAIAPFRASKLASLLTPESLQRGSHAAHPLGKVPAIEDQDLTLFESGAILEYILERYGKGRLAPAPGTPDRGPYLQWVHFAEATALSPLGDIVSHTYFLPEPRCEDLIDGALGGYTLKEDDKPNKDGYYDHLQDALRYLVMMNYRPETAEPIGPRHTYVRPYRTGDSSTGY